MKFMHCVKTFALSAGLVVLTGASAFATAYDFPAGPTYLELVPTPGTFTSDGITFTGGGLVSSAPFGDVVSTPGVYASTDIDHLEGTATLLTGVIGGSLATPASNLEVYLNSIEGSANVATVTAYSGATDDGSKTVSLDGYLNNLGDTGRLGEATFVDPGITSFTVSDSLGGISLYAPVVTPEASTSVAFGIGVAILGSFALLGRRKTVVG